MKKSGRGALGTSFDSWLDEQGEGFKAEVLAGAIKRQLVNRLRSAMKARGLGVNALQKLLSTGPSQVQRILDPDDTGISLKSMARVLALLGLPARLTFGRASDRRAA